MVTRSQSAAPRIRRLAIIYDNRVRPDTTGEYCRRALEALGHAVSHYQPSEVGEIAPIYDLYLRVDDDLEYALPENLHPLVYWAIDTHRDYPRRLTRARPADFAVCAQQNGAARMREDGIRQAHWLPLACDPEIHRRLPGMEKQYDICFVGNTFPGDGERSRRVEWIRRAYPRAFVGQAYGEEMARIYTASRLVFNCAIRDDVNMRVFEAAACGSLLVTNDLAENGQDLLFTAGTHLVTYRTDEDLAALIPRYLGDEALRERMAEAGMRHAQARHTYQQRMRNLLAALFEGGDLAGAYPVEGGRRLVLPQPANRETRGQAKVPEGSPPGTPSPPHRVAGPAPSASGGGRPLVSIIIPCFNHLDLTQRCLASIRQSTDLPYEVVIVDNGSSDGTATWAVGEGLRVIANTENLGFPRACNQGLLAAHGEFLLLLNNDTVVSPGWLTGLLQHAEADPSVGLVGPSTNFAAGRQRIEASYASQEEFLAFAARLAREQAGQAESVPALVGVCLLIPRRVMLAVGLLDERFGLGNFEDNDYCLRVRMAGFRVLWVRHVFIHHQGHQSFRDLGEGFQRLLESNERLYREKWNLARYLDSPAPPPPWLATGAGNGTTPSRVRMIEGGSRNGGAWSLLQAGRYPEAYDAFEELVRAEPGDVRALLGLGLSAEGRGVPAAARMAYEAVLRLAPGDPDASRGLERIGDARLLGANRR